MHIFLDTNAIYKDPFLQKGKNRILLQLAKHNDVHLYISKTVYSELLRRHKLFVESELKAANEAISKISPFFRKNRDEVTLNVKAEDLIWEFTNHFEEKEIEGQLHVIAYDVDVLERIVKVDMHEMEPFIKKYQVLNKRGQEVAYEKKEIRDAIIWNTYEVFIEKNKLEDCYFISNNTKEFGAIGANKSPQEEPYPLHPALAKTSKMTAIKTIHDFLAYKSGEVKSLFQDTTLHLKLLSHEMYDQVYKELENGLAEKLVHEFFMDDVLSQTYEYLSRMQPEDVHDDYYVGGYVMPTTMNTCIERFELQDFDVYGEDLTVAVDVNIEMDVDVYLYNSAHDGWEDKHTYYATDTIRVEETVIFILPLDATKQLNVENFSLADYIEGGRPTNLDVEIQGYRNVRHQNMFPEDEYVH